MAHRNHLSRGRWRGRAWLATMCLVGLLPIAEANVDVDVHGVDDQLRANVLAYLSFDRYKKRTDLSADTVERLHNRVEREVQSALKPFGYYEPKVESEVKDLGRGDWRVTIDINPGPPVLIDKVDVKVEGPGAADPLFERITANPPLHVGDRLNHATYESIKGDLQRTAATYGYLDARLTRNELVVDPKNHRASVALEMQTGERYRFGATTIEQASVRDALVRRYLRYKEGDPFDLTQVLRTQFALDDAQYFANLEVLPLDADRQAHTVPVSIRADRSRRNRYSFGAGYATDTGVRGTLTWEDRRVNTLGHRLSVTVEASQVQRYLVQSRYIIPIGDPAVENLTFQGTVEQLQLADIVTHTASIGPSVTKVSGNWQYVWFANAMRTIDDSIAGVSTARMLVPGIDIASVPKGYLGEPIFQHPFFAEIRGSDSRIGSNANFLQLHIQAEHVFQLADKWHLLLRDELGATAVQHWSDVPAVMRFFAGGDNSVRGFAFDELSPIDAVCAKDALGNSTKCQTYKDGGKNLITGTFEVIRDLPRNFGVATFFDYGNAFNHIGDPLEYSAGVGFRVRLPVVTLGIDVAQPLSRSAGPRLHINFSPKL
ncbi:MAG TPA: BamA/TamA family outer membrane protein [Steroidobacteraceae bacterium]|nr:BamA/TamA family outer membrane protein [Steroidobacteraceae bacterium]